MADNNFIEKLDFESDTFSQIKTDMNFVLQRLLGTMVERETDEGSMTIKIDVKFDPEYIPNYDRDTDGETRKINKPQFKHKVTSQVKISDEKSGNLNSEMELAMDDNGCYYMKPITGAEQRSIYDYMEEQSADDDNVIEADGQYIEGTATPLLPGPEESDTDENTPESPQTDAESSDDNLSGDDTENAPMDGNGFLFGDNEEDSGEDSNSDDDYGYEEPGE